jgi:hypothetical protein
MWQGAPDMISREDSEKSDWRPRRNGEKSNDDSISAQ